jgi:RNA polymerase sigma-70 factor, ECF subfamily
VPQDLPNPPKTDSDALTAEFVRLLKQHERQLNGYIMALVSDWHVADEIAQETCIRLWEQFHNYRRDMDFGAWARTIARYEVLSYHKRISRERLRFSQQFIDTVAQRWEGMRSELNGQLDALMDCMSLLADQQYKLVRLCYRGDRTIKQVADDLGRPYDATYKALERARKTLHDCVLKKTRGEESK